jgi:hypothetical protein
MMELSCQNGSARPRSLETRKGRGFPHSHSDGDYRCQIGTNCQTRANRTFLQILVQNRKISPQGPNLSELGEGSMARRN